MSEVIRAVFATTSAADAAAHELQVARIPSATISQDSEQSRKRPTVTVAVDDMHADAITGILNQYGPLDLEERAT